MPDFRRLVRENLPLPPMKRRREEKIIEELAVQLADLYRDARARGLDDAQARPRPTCCRSSAWTRRPGGCTAATKTRLAQSASC